MATMWTAAGGEEYLDEDGFVLGNEMPDEDFDCSGSVSQKHSTSGPIQSEFDQSQSRGGFGSPKKKTGKQKGVLNGHSTSKQENKSKADNRPSRMSVPSVDDLRVTTMRGNVKAAQDYLEQGLAVDVVLRSGWTPLMYAASFANQELVEIFLEKGADVNFHQDQFSVLMASCSSSQPQEDRVLRCAQLLVEAGANVNSHDRYHMSPLIYAAREGHAKVIQYLVEKGGNLDKQDCRGWTALSWAVSKNCKLAVQKLLQLTANPYMQHCDGQTAADIAFAENFQDFLVLMKDSRAESSNDRVASPTGVVTTEVPAAKNRSSSLTSTYVKQGELELFLSGLGLSTLIPLFQHHHVDFAGFLRLTDHDLQQIGVGQVGVRKKILDGVQTVHTKEWQPSSLAVQYNKRLSYTQCVALMTNISAHLKYITSSVGYVNDQLTAHPSTLDSQDGCGPRALYQLSQEAQTRLQHLGSEVTGLQTRVNKVLSKCNYEPADLVHKPRGRSKRRKVWVRRGILLCSLGGAVAVTVYFRDSVKCTLVDTFTETVTRIKQFW